jgi:hypothetical protein
MTEWQNAVLCHFSLSSLCHLVHIVLCHLSLCPLTLPTPLQKKTKNLRDITDMVENLPLSERRIEQEFPSLLPSLLKKRKGSYFISLLSICLSRLAPFSTV